MAGRLRVFIYAAILVTGLGGGAVLGSGPAAADGGHGTHGLAFAHDQGGSGQGHHHHGEDATEHTRDSTTTTSTTTSSTDERTSAPGTEPTTSDPKQDLEVSSEHHKAPPTLPTSTTCQIRGKVTFTPALKTGGTTASTVTVTGLLSRCTSGTTGHRHARAIENGHLSGLTGTVAQNDCATFMSNTAPALAGGTIAWTPHAKVTSSTGISFPVGTGSTATAGGRSVIAVSYTGGSVAGGSFSNTGATSLTVTSMQKVDQLSSRCVSGLHDAAFTGSISL